MAMHIYMLLHTLKALNPALFEACSIPTSLVSHLSDNRPQSSQVNSSRVCQRWEFADAVADAYFGFLFFICAGQAQTTQYGGL